MQAINPINTHTKFGKDRINTFPSNEQKPNIWTPEKAKIICPPPHPPHPQWGGHKNLKIVTKTTITKVLLHFNVYKHIFTGIPMNFDGKCILYK